MGLRSVIVGLYDLRMYSLDSHPTLIVCSIWSLVINGFIVAETLTCHSSKSTGVINDMN